MTEKKRKNKRIISFLTASVIFLISVIGIIPIQTDAASSSEIRKQINVLKEQKSEIEDRIKEVQAQYQANEDEIADITALALPTNPRKLFNVFSEKLSELISFFTSFLNCCKLCIN